MSQVCRTWRQFFVETGSTRRFIRQLENFKSEDEAIMTLEKDFSEVDDVLLYCFMKHMEKSGVVYGWGWPLMALREWGRGARLGSHLLPVQIKKLGTVTSVLAGSNTSFMIKNGDLVAVGDNRDGKLGLGVERPPKVLEPNKVELPPIESLASKESSYAIDKSGRLWSWGNNKHGQLGYRFDSGSPQLVDSLQDYKIKQVACGDSFACCLTTDGEVFTWGDKGLIGHGRLASNVREPRKLDIERISQISCGWGNTLLLSADQKTVWAFGANLYGEGGRPEEESLKVPAKVPFLGTKIIRKIQSGENCSVALTEDGEIIMWGCLLGHEDEENGHIPRVVELKQKAIDISISGEFMLALTVDNRLYAFGCNHAGQCGQGTTSRSIEQPVEVKNLQNLRIKQISAGRDHCLIKCSKL